MGPIGLLAEELAGNNCCLNEHLEIIQHTEQPMSITRTPWQDLKRQVEGIVKRQRIKDATERRTYLGKMDEFDNEVFNAAVKKRNDEEQHIIQYIMSGAWFKTKDKNELGVNYTSLCQLCGEEEIDITHILWDCKKKTRYQKLCQTQGTQKRGHTKKYKTWRA